MGVRAYATAAACAAAAAVLVTAVYAASGSSGRRPPSNAAAIVVDDATIAALSTSAEIRYPGAGVELRAASRADAQAARIGAEDALKAFARSGVRHELVDAQRVMRLVRFTDVMQGVEGANGEIVPTHRDVLAWALIVPGAPVVTQRPIPADQRPAACDFVFVADATTGAEVSAFQACRRELAGAPPPAA